MKWQLFLNNVTNEDSTIVGVTLTENAIQWLQEKAIQKNSSYSCLIDSMVSVESIRESVNFLNNIPRGKERFGAYTKRRMYNIRSSNVAKLKKAKEDSGESVSAILEGIIRLKRLVR